MCQNCQERKKNENGPLIITRKPSPPCDWERPLPSPCDENENVFSVKPAPEQTVELEFVNSTSDAEGVGPAALVEGGTTTFRPLKKQKVEQVELPSRSSSPSDDVVAVLVSSA